MPSESKALYTLVDPSSPPYFAPCGQLPFGASQGAEEMVEAPGTAPGSERLITTAFIAIAGRIRQQEYKPNWLEIKVVGGRSLFAAT